MNRKWMNLVMLCVLLATMLHAPHVNAQKTTVVASVDSTQMWIGQQTRLVFELNQQEGKKVRTPLFSDQIIDGIELVEPVRNDTSVSADGHTVVRQTYLITSFNDSLFLIPAFPFVEDETDTIWSNPVSVKIIQPFVIDTAANEIADIKDVVTPPFSWKYFFKKLLPWLIGLLLIVAIGYLLLRLFKKKPVPESPQPELLIPAYVLALNKLKELKEEKLWQHDRQKEYHSQLTEILREYIERVFEIPAPEMTSDELLSHLNLLRKENKEAYMKLQQILQLADLVKFAKWHATPDENELSITNAVEFVTLTKPEENVENDIS